MTAGVRDPTVAGKLYSDDPQQLRVDIDELLEGVESEYAAPKAIILPESGLDAAGREAVPGYALLESERGRVETVVIVASSSSSVVTGVAAPRSVAFRTPLGDMLVDRGALGAVSRHPALVFNDQPHLREHGIEVHLPFIQRLLGTPRIVPLLVGRTDLATVADVLERVWGGPNTVILVSSDLVAKYDGSDAAAAARAPEAISTTRNALLQMALDESHLTRLSAPIAVGALLTVARRRAMGIVELASSSPTAEEGRTIAHSSYALWEAPLAPLAEADVRHLRELARAAVATTVLGGRVTGSDQSRLPPALAVRRAAFVTLTRDGELRGCIGNIEAERSLASSVVRHAGVACADPRVASVQPTELSRIDIGISVVGPLERVFATTRDELWQAIERGTHGLMVRSPNGRSTFLPVVWESLPDPNQFLDELLRRAGADPAESLDAVEIHRYRTIEY